MKPTLFIGSSAEGREVAGYLQAELERDAESTIWDQGVFGLSGGTLAALVEASRRFEFAALVLTPDDLVITRARERPIARDNVLFELGLFMGSIGRERTFIVTTSAHWRWLEDVNVKTWHRACPDPGCAR